VIVLDEESFVANLRYDIGLDVVFLVSRLLGVSEDELILKRWLKRWLKRR